MEGLVKKDLMFLFYTKRRDEHDFSMRIFFVIKLLYKEIVGRNYSTATIYWLRLIITIFRITKTLYIAYKKTSVSLKKKKESFFSQIIIRKPKSLKSMTRTSTTYSNYMLDWADRDFLFCNFCILVHEMIKVLTALLE